MVRTIGISTDGTVNTINITKAGTGYYSETPPVVTISSPATGTQAKAHVPKGDGAGGIGVNGSVVGIVIDDPGSGYTETPNIVIQPPLLLSGTNQIEATAEAEAVLSLGFLALDGIDSVKQRLTEALQMIKGEYFRNPQEGVDFVTILNRGGSAPQFLTGALIQRAHEVDDVVSAQVTGSSLNKDGTYRVRMQAETIFGVTEVAVVIPF